MERVKITKFKHLYQKIDINFENKKMAQAAGVVASGTFNALAFTGFSFLFRTLDNDNYLKEVKRHNMALEHFARARQRWYENEVAYKDEIQRLKQELNDANKDINATNNALNQLKNIRTITYNNGKCNREPHLYDFYTPSKEMEEYALVTAGLASGIAGWGVYKFLL